MLWKILQLVHDNLLNKNSEMDRHIHRPKDLTIDPNAADASKVFKYWLQTVTDYIATLEELRQETTPTIKRLES